jgi:hypothetical protein
MSVVVIVLSLLLAIILTVGVVGGLLHREPFSSNFRRLRVTPAQRLIVLGTEAAAVVGLVVGLWWAPLNVAAASGVLLLMMGAFLFHWRARDRAGEYAFAVLVTAVAAGIVSLQALTGAVAWA